MDDQQKQIGEIREMLLGVIQRLDNFDSYQNIPLQVANSIKIRVLPNNFLTGRTVPGTPSTVTINESGSATVIAQAPLTGKIGITIDNVEYTVPIL